MIDIGSNSIRLVVYDARSRAPLPMLNESMVCALGRDLASCDRLGEAAMNAALRAIDRFCSLGRAIGVERLSLIATAAVREASNGRDFADRILATCGAPVDVLSGGEEGRMSALGVAWAMPCAVGVVGDLGGGSLELVEIAEGRILHQATLPLGILRLSTLHAECRAGANVRIRKALAGVEWLARGTWRNFYPVGGAWRAVARAHMAHIDHPLHMIDGYSVPAGRMSDVSDWIAGLGPQALRGLRGVSERRRSSLPLAGDLMRATLAATGAARVTFSAHGLREGVLYTRLSEAERSADPALAAARELAGREARFDSIGTALFAWVAPLFEERHAGRRRLRLIACTLADIGWREHPDYRDLQAFQRILRFPFPGLAHAERVFLAYAVFVRYAGAQDASGIGPAIALMPARARRRAAVLGLALRLAFTVSGGARKALRRTLLEISGGRLVLRLSDDANPPPRDRLLRQLETLAGACRMQGGRVVG